MDDPAAIPLGLLQDAEPARFAESARFEARSVTGASYTIVEHRNVGGDEGADEAGAAKRYRTAYAGLPVVANDDGSFTIVSTHTRLTRVEHC